MPKEKPKEKDDFENEVVIKSPDDALVLWKPTKKGETVSGKLMVITQTEFNDILRLSTEEGVVSVPVSTYTPNAYPSAAWFLTYSARS